MIRSISLILAFTSSLGILQAQTPPNIEWSINYGGSLWDEANDIIETSDGGYMAVGSTLSNDIDVSGNQGLEDIWIVKMTSTGTMEWQKTFGGSDMELAAKVIETDDLGYLIIGHTASDDGDITINHGGYDIWVIKIDLQGNLIWETTFGGTYDEQGFSIMELPSSELMISGSTKSVDGDVSMNHGLYDAWVVKTDSQGVIIWENTYGGSASEHVFDLEQAENGEFIFVGETKSMDGDVSLNHGERDVWVVKTDSLGTVLWETSIGGTEDDSGYDIDRADAGGYIIAARTNSNDGDIPMNQGMSDFLSIRLDTLGNMIWLNTFGGSSQEFPQRIEKTNDLGFIMIGYTLSNDGDISNNLGAQDFWVIKIDSIGTLVWERTFGGSMQDIGMAITATIDGSFVIAGHTYSSDFDVLNNYGANDFWVAKISYTASIFDEARVTTNLWPNPASESTNISFELPITYQINGNLELSIVKMDGRLVHDWTMNEQRSFSYNLNVSDLPSGLYFVQLRDGNGLLAGRTLIVQ